MRAEVTYMWRFRIKVKLRRGSGELTNNRSGTKDRFRQNQPHSGGGEEGNRCRRGLDSPAFPDACQPGK